MRRQLCRPPYFSDHIELSFFESSLKEFDPIVSPLPARSISLW